MENIILKNKYFTPIILGLISVFVLLNSNELVSPFVKYFFMLILLVMTFYHNPFAIINVLTDKNISNNTEKVLRIISYIIISIISAYLIILMFTANENILYFGKILAGCNAIFTIVLYFTEKSNPNLLIIHLLLVFIFTTLVQVLN